MMRLLLILTALTLPTAVSGEDRRPNVVLIVTDDQGYGDMACHGNPLLSTPHLDRLGASGVALDDYHVDPVCTPTRAALMTGRYCGRVGAWNVIHGRQLLHRREVTMADVFRSSGYVTAMFGKWHLGDPWPYDPGSRGFEQVVCHRAGGVDELGNPVGNNYFDDIYYRNGVAEPFEGYCTDVFFDEAVRFIREMSINDERRPFFLYLPTNAMHSPFGVPERYARRFRDMQLPEKRARFYGMIENFDENLGRLLTSLDELGQSKDTLVIFMGDNGTAANSGELAGAFNAGMRGDKGSVYDGGHRVSCFVRWPAGITGGRVVDELTTHRDWLPTLIDLCNLQRPEVRFDGQSMAQLLRGDADDWPDRTLVVERQGTEPAHPLSGDQPQRPPPYAVMTRRWRLVNGELYDIKADPAQTIDLAAERPRLVEKLKSSYQQYYADVFANVDDEPCFIVGSPESMTTEFTARDWRPTKGGVIWEMPQLERDDLWIQGYWPIEVAQPGTYKIEFARFPFDAERPMGATEAHLEIGATTKSAPIDPQAARVSFTTHLPAGRMRLRGRLQDATTGRSRGPYFVRITRL